MKDLGARQLLPTPTIDFSLSCSICGRHEVAVRLVNKVDPSVRLDLCRAHGLKLIEYCGFVNFTEER